MLTPVDMTFIVAIITLLLYLLCQKKGFSATRKPKCRVKIFYATESGTAEQLAFRFGSNLSCIISEEMFDVVNLRAFRRVSPF